MKRGPSTTCLIAGLATALAGPASSVAGDAASELLPPEGMLTRSSTPGLALAVEAGRYRGGYALALAYYQPLAGLPGLVLGAGANAGISGFEPRTPAWGINLFASYGEEHRALLLLGYALEDRTVLRLHGSDAAERSWWGPEASLGYELVTVEGAVIRALIGTVYVPQRSLAIDERFRATLTFSVGWKFW